MMRYFVLVLCVLTSVCLAYDFAARVRYRYFDDYLSHLDVRQKDILVGDRLQSNVEGSGDVEPEQADDFTPLVSRPLPLRTGSQRSKEMTCCMLGQLAGDKGYHCFVKFYAARVLNRNYNRAHNKKIVGLLPRNRDTKARRSSDKLMRTFQQCVMTPRSITFNKCCQLSAMESGRYSGSSRSGISRTGASYRRTGNKVPKTV